MRHLLIITFMLLSVTLLAQDDTTTVKQRRSGVGFYGGALISATPDHDAAGGSFYMQSVASIAGVFSLSGKLGTGGWIVKKEEATAFQNAEYGTGYLFETAVGPALTFGKKEIFVDFGYRSGPSVAFEDVEINFMHNFFLIMRTPVSKGIHFTGNIETTVNDGRIGFTTGVGLLF